MAVALIAMALVAAMGIDPVSASADPKGHITLEVVSGEEPRTVQLTAAKSKPFLIGATTLFIRLKEKEDPKLYVRFVPESPGGRALLCGAKPRVFLDSERADSKCHFTPRSIEGKDLIGLRVAFRLPIGEPLDSVAGSLILGLNGKDESVPIPFVVAPRQFKDLAVMPDTVSLDSDNPEATVTLVGPDVVPFLRSRGFGNTSVALRDDAGDTATATISFDSAREVQESDNPELAKGTLELEGDPPDPGKYTGKLPLSHAFPEGPSVTVELHAHKSWLCMAFVVFLGIAFGGLVTRLVTTMRRRTMLLETLDANVADYMLASETGQIESWDPNDRLKLSGYENPRAKGPRHAIEVMVCRYCESLPAFIRRHLPTALTRRCRQRGEKRRTGLRLLGLLELERSIETARSSTDLDEDAERVIEMVAQIQRWLRVEPVARLLANVSEEMPEELLTGETDDDKDGSLTTLAWEESQTHIDTLALLEMARREPPDAEKADDLVQRLLFQAKWHHGSATAWRRAVSGADRELATKLVRLDKKMKDDATTIGALKPDELDARDGRLRALLGSSHALPFPDEHRPTEPEWRKKRGMPEVDWDASPSLFTGWATLDAPSLKQLSLRAAVTSRTRYRSPVGVRYLREALTLKPVDLGASLGILLVAATAYSLANFNDTWGNLPDLGKAFLAGLTGTAAVKWAALPIFRSTRIRATAKEA